MTQGGKLVLLSRRQEQHPEMHMHDLPTEILLVIFETLVDLPSPSFTNPPCRVAEVCRLWHAQSLLIPKLRTILPLITFNTSHPVLHDLDKVDTLSFAMRAVSARHKDHGDFVEVLGRSARWEHAEFLGLHTDLLRGMSYNLMHEVPLLHTLKLNIDVQREDFAGYLYAFDDAPCLRHLELECATNILFRAPFHQLVEYVERSATAIGIGRVLQPEAKIQTLSYYCFPTAAIPLTLVQHQTQEPLPHLSTLNLHLSSAVLEALLSPLTLPALARLRIVTDSGDSVETIQGLISRSKCILSTLSLRVVDVSPGTNVLDVQRLATRTIGNHASLLRECSELRKLELDHPDVPLFEEIMEPSSPSFLPHLKEFIAHLNHVRNPPHPKEREERDSTRTLSTSSSDASSRNSALGSTLSRRTPFVRLIFPSAGERASAHALLEGRVTRAGTLEVDKQLRETTRFLSVSMEAVRWWNTFSSTKGPSSKLPKALSSLESGHGAVGDPWQVVLSRVFVPLDKIHQSQSTSLQGLSERAGVILEQLDARLQQLVLEWRSENEFTLIRTGKPCTATMSSLLLAERSYPSGQDMSSIASTPPWGFVDLIQRIGQQHSA